MTAKEVCKTLGFSMPTLYRRVADGELKPLPKPPGLKKHHRLMFARADIEQLIAQSQTARQS